MHRVFYLQVTFEQKELLLPPEHSPPLSSLLGEISFFQRSCACQKVLGSSLENQSLGHVTPDVLSGGILFSSDIMRQIRDAGGQAA